MDRSILPNSYHLKLSVAFFFPWCSHIYFFSFVTDRLSVIINVSFDGIVNSDNRLLFSFSSLSFSACFNLMANGSLRQRSCSEIFININI